MDKINITNILVVIDGETKPIKELSQPEYEFFLNQMTQLHAAYTAIMSNRK